VPLLDARLAVGTEADLGNTVSAAGGGLGRVESLRAKGLAREFLRSTERFRLAWAEFARCATFRVEGLRAPGWRAIGTGARPKGPASR
jgi:hypothetical protein